LHENVPTSTLCNNKKLETTEISINDRMAKYVVKKVQYYVPVKINELPGVLMQT
jgi:hypothetical protein